MITQQTNRISDVTPSTTTTASKIKDGLDYHLLELCNSMEKHAAFNRPIDITIACKLSARASYQPCQRRFVAQPDYDQHTQFGTLKHTTNCDRRSIDWQIYYTNSSD